MLVDIQIKSLTIDPLFALLGSGSPERIAKGVYQTAGYNFDHVLESSGLLLQRYPFDPMFTVPDFQNLDTAERLRLIMEDWESRPRDYGVCDNWEQIVEKWPGLESDPRHFIISVTEVRREHQSDWGGWRWHKWGEYIGTKEPTREYLYDEPDIDAVFVFHILQVSC